MKFSRHSNNYLDNKEKAMNAFERTYGVLALGLLGLLIYGFVGEQPSNKFLLCAMVLMFVILFLDIASAQIRIINAISRTRRSSDRKKQVPPMEELPPNS
jgi:hypothetical protein